MIGQVFILCLLGSALSEGAHAETFETERGIRDGVQQTLANIYGGAKEVVSEIVEVGKARLSKLRNEYEEMKLKAQAAIEERRKIFEAGLVAAQLLGAQEYEDAKKGLELAFKEEQIKIQAELDDFKKRLQNAFKESQSEDGVA